MRKNIFIISLCVLFLFVVGCQEKEDTSNNEAEQNNTTNNDEANNENSNGTANDEAETPEDFPVTIEIGDQSVDIAEKPEHILPLSLDVAEIVLELVDPSKVVAVTEGVEDPQLSTQTDKADEIPNRVSSAVNIDPEEILSFDTDLLLLTEVHGQEADANTILSETDIPIITFDAMLTVDDLLENIATIGKAIGEEAKATDLVETMTSDIETIQSQIPEDADAPTVLVLSEVGPGTGPFMMGPSNISYDLIKLAGAEPAVDDIDLESSSPASIEQVMKMDPDYIFLLDFVGEGDDVFTDLMENPGWDSLEAIKNDHVKVLDVKYLMNPNVDVIEGLEIMVDWIYE